MSRASLLLAAAACAWAQNAQDVVRQGEQVFAKTCATGYCHGPKGAPGGAPRLAGRGFDQGFINTTLAQGVPGTGMPSFAATLPRADFVAVAAYVASLNGVVAPSASAGAPVAAAVLSPEAVRGRGLFSDAVRGFARCSTCHEVNGIGISVATPISQVPAGADALRALATPSVSTATMGGESMPALLVRKTGRDVVFYDLTASPPVLRTADPALVTIAEGSTWKHSSVISSYNAAELNAILEYLRIR